MYKEDFKKHFNYVVNKLSLNVKSYNLYYNAFIHPSFANEHNTENYERLEFLGDAVLDLLVARFLYLNFPQMQEGQMTKLKATFVCESANSEYSKNLSLDKCVLLGKGEEEQGGKNKPSVLGDIFEAFLGACYLDEGLDKVDEILRKIVYPKILAHDIEFFIDYKSKLQEYIQAESRKGITYIIENETGPAHNKTFTASCIHENIKLGVGSGKSKKDAEQMAAKDALQKLVK